MTYEIKTTKCFKRDLKIVSKRGYKIELLIEVVDTIAHEISLPQRHKDHCLTGNWNSYRECHIEPDWLLIYRIMPQEKILILVRTGSHSDLF